MHEILLEIYKNSKQKLSSIWVVIAITIIGCCVLISICDNIKVMYIGCLAIMFLGLYKIIEIFLDNRLPKARKEHLGVLIRILSKDEDEYNDTKIKFGNEFEAILESDNIDVVYIPYRFSEKYKCNDSKRIINLLEKTRCVFLTTVDVKSENTSDEIRYLTKINMGIMHPAYAKSAEKQFQQEMNILGCQSANRIEYSNRNKMIVLEVVAKHVSFICQYVIARATYFNGDLRMAGILANDLYENIKSINMRGEILKKLTTVLCYNIHFINSMVEFENKYMDLEIVESELQKANKYISNTYEYNLNMSVCCFLRYRDINKVKKYLNNCKQIQPKGEWKYNEAFLCAYEGNSEGKVLSKYLQAVKCSCDIYGLIVFIEEILLEEPEKNMLRFALFLLYLELNDFVCAKELLTEYLFNKDSKKLDKDTKERIKRKYTTKELCWVFDLN